MSANFNKLWAKVRTAESEADSIRALAQILLSREGRAFVLGLGPIDGVLCIELIDHVRPNATPTIRDAYSPF